MGLVLRPRPPSGQGQSVEAEWATSLGSGLWSGPEEGTLNQTKDGHCLDILLLEIDPSEIDFIPCWNAS